MVKRKKSCFFTYGNCRVGHLPDLLSCRLLHAANDGDYRSFACTFPEKIRTCGDLNYDDYTTDYHDRFMYRRNDASLDCLGNYLLYATAAFCFLILLFSAVVFFPFYRYVLFSQYHTLSGKKLTIILILHCPSFPFFAKIYIPFFKIFFMYSRYPSSSMRKSQLLSVKICFRFSVTISYILFAFF